MQLTISTVFPQPRPWGEKYPDNCSVRFVFSDGTTGEYATKKDKAEEHIKALSALIGKPADFEIKEVKEREGIIERRISSYPGKPQGGGSFGGGGKGNWTPAWSQTEAGERYTQERMDRRTSLMQAVSLYQNSSFDAIDVCALAQKFYVWLRASDSVSTPTPPTPHVNVQNASASVSAPSTGTLIDDSNYAPPFDGAPDYIPAFDPQNLNRGSELCSVCHAPPGKPHAKGCTA